MLFVVTAYPLQLPRGRRSQVALELGELTSRLKLGAFYVDENDGQINFRLGQFLCDQTDEVLSATIVKLIMIAMNVTDTYFRKMMSLAAVDAESAKCIAYKCYQKRVHTVRLLAGAVWTRSNA